MQSSGVLTACTHRPKLPELLARALYGLQKLNSSYVEVITILSTGILRFQNWCADGALHVMTTCTASRLV